MMKIVLCLVPIIIFALEYAFIKKYDKESPFTDLKVTDFILPCCFWLMGDYLIIKAASLYDMWTISIIVGYLAFQSLCDGKYKKVYCIYNYLVIVYGGITDIVWIVNCHNTFEESQRLTVLIWVCVFLLVGRIGRLYGGGDEEVILALTTLLLPVSLLTISTFLMGICAGFAFLLVQRLVEACRAKLRGKTIDQGIALVPGITLGVLVAIGLV